MQIGSLKELAAILGVTPRTVHLFAKRESMPGRISHRLYDVVQCVEWYSKRNSPRLSVAKEY
jgi:hypothetical protein